MSNDARPEFDVQALVDQYGLGGVRSVRKAQGGQVNENWIVRTSADTVVVRRVSNHHSLDHIRFEHSFIRALGREGFPYRLPEPLRTRAGRSVVTKNGKYVWLYSYIEGSNARPSWDTVIAEMAHALATAHKAARRFSLRPANAIPFVLDNPWLLQALRRLQLKTVNSRGEYHRFFRSRVQECIGMLEQLRGTRYGALPRLPIHGDMCIENLIFAKDGLRGVIDFGHCCSDAAIRDIAIAVRYECTNPNDRFRLNLDAARRFLKIYHRINPLTRDETDLIPAVAIAEAADLFRWKMVEVVTKRIATPPPVWELEKPFKAMRWYSRHQRDIASALRM